MAIERLSFPEYLGLVNSVPFDAADGKARPVDLLAHYASQIRVLSEGEYNITPRSWTKNLYNHQLLVFADGTGIYRVLPKGPDSGRIEFERQEEGTFNVRTGSGGKVIYLPGDTQIATVAGNPTIDEEHLRGRIFEILFYVPGISPSEEHLGFLI